MDVLAPVTLRPGDRRIRAVVRQALPAGDPWWVERSCARCGQAMDAQSGALVVYGPHEACSPATAPVCGGCATLLTPLRLALCIGPLRSLRSADPVGREAAELVGRILALRADPPTDVMWIRAQDVHGIARRLGTTRSHLVVRLRDLDVLSDVHRATRHERGTHRRAPQPHRANA